MTTFRSELDVSALRTDINQDILHCSVGMYKLFMAHGDAGHDAKQLYLHLQFTARLQETLAVRANNTYLANGLCWGVARVKRAKAWLKDHLIISYVRRRHHDGTLGETYIQIDRMVSIDSPEPVDETEHVDDSQVWLDFSNDVSPAYAREPIATVTPPIECGRESRPARNLYSTTDIKSTTGTDIHPVVEPPCGAEQQMLNINKEMLRTRKINLFSPDGEEREKLSTSHDHEIPPTREARELWISAYTEKWEHEPQFAAAEASLLKRDVARVGIEAFTAATEAFFSDTVADVVHFVRDHGAGYGYRVFSTQVDKLLVHLARTRGQSEKAQARASPPATCPACGGNLVYTTDRCGCRGCRVFWDFDPGTNEWLRDPETGINEASTARMFAEVRGGVR